MLWGVALLALIGGVTTAVISEKDDLPSIRQAAEAEDAGAQDKLGQIYIQGQGVAQDDAEAVRWFRQAAERGNPEGQFHLGIVYAKGQGVGQDDAEAVRWFRKAA